MGLGLMALARQSDVHRAGNRPQTNAAGGSPTVTTLIRLAEALDYGFCSSLPKKHARDFYRSQPLRKLLRPWWIEVLIREEVGPGLSTHRQAR